MNVIISISNSIEKKDCIIKTLQYTSLFFASMLESNSIYKLRFYDSYCRYIISNINSKLQRGKKNIPTNKIYSTDTQN